MNLLTQFKKIPILPLIIALALVVGAPAVATPVCGVNTETLAVGHYPSGLLDLMCRDLLTGWNLKTKVKGDSDVYVTRHTFQPGNHTGWHTHPGPSLITVIAGRPHLHSARLSDRRKLYRYRLRGRTPGA